MKKALHSITVNGKKYPYSMRVGKEVTHFVCKAGGVDQGFLNEDIPALLRDLPKLIISEIEYNKAQDGVVRFRVNAEEKKAIAKRAVKEGYPSVSSFLRAVALGK